MRLGLLASSALLLLALGASPQARAFSTQTLNNSNPDGSARFVDPDEQSPFGLPSNHAAPGPAQRLKAPQRSHSVENAPVVDDTPGEWDAAHRRLLFGPFNHFGYSLYNR